MHLTLQNGETALMLASNEGKVECVDMLLDSGADMNMLDKVSGVIIHCAHAIQNIPRVPISGCSCLDLGILFRQALPFMLFDFCYM